MFLSCQHSGRKRPYGYLRLGPLKEFLSSETFLEQQGILVRRDENGFYAMSTYCTYDLTHLSLKKKEATKILASSFTKSTYDLTGHVLTGPAEADLPYYELSIAAQSVESPIATLYVQIGDRVSSSWRLNVPELQDSYPN
ncbi:MAG: Rieske 2Fe-2S domain-containing protein [Bdellovibrionales bacterium]|nr:Rieske 2Fe-2S domain-containing protein [Bdellovibrionales bacterium]